MESYLFECMVDVKDVPSLLALIDLLTRKCKSSIVLLLEWNFRIQKYQIQIRSGKTSSRPDSHPGYTEQEDVQSAGQPPELHRAGRRLIGRTVTRATQSGKTSNRPDSHQSYTEREDVQ